MKRYNSNYQQFSEAKATANAVYLDKLAGPVQELLEYGFGYRALANALNQRGFLSQRGQPFSRDSVRVLLNKLGRRTSGGESECKEQ